MVRRGPLDTDFYPADSPFAAFPHGMMGIRHFQVEEVAELAASLAGPRAALIIGATHPIERGHEPLSPMTTIPIEP